MARVQEYSGIVCPPLLVKVDREDEARFIEQHRVDARDEWLSGIVVAGQVPSNDGLIDGKKSLARAFRALDTRLLADPADPFVRTGWRVSGLAGLPAFKATGIDVFTTAEQRTEQGDLCLSGGLLIDEKPDRLHRNLGAQREEEILSSYDRGPRVR